jgi:hypothetical protein
MTLADELLAALVKHESERPRSQQARLGPSELGGCREYIRNLMVGTPLQGNSEWPTAAAVGTLVGEYVEAVAERYLGAVTQVSVTTTLPNGLVVSGTADIVLAERNVLADVKSKDGLSSIRREGPSLENCVQVSIYVLGLVQMGVLTEGASASLLYVDRSGSEQSVYEVTLDWERIQYFIGVVVDRLSDVLEAQEHIDAGEVEWARALRDKTPPFCYSEKVLCPFRDACWAGSEWVPNEVIEDPDVILAVERYVQARADQNSATADRARYKEQLRGVSGITPDGYSVNWSSENTLYVTRVKEKSE